MAADVIPQLAALAVVIEADRVLLVRRRNKPDAGLWGYPGGHVEPGETVHEAAVRELSEETGLSATARETLLNLDVIRHDADGHLRHHYLLVAVLCQTLSGEMAAADDAEEAIWHPVRQVLSGRLALSRDVERVLRRALEVLG